jgi:RNase P/RNase MRP subunit POP5
MAAHPRVHGGEMSVKRPPRRYIGLRFEPASASRKEVGQAIEACFASARKGDGPAAPRLLVCEAGAAIVLVPRGEEAGARRALAKQSGGALRLTPVVTSGTISSVKLRLSLSK